MENKLIVMFLVALHLVTISLMFREAIVARNRYRVLMGLVRTNLSSIETRIRDLHIYMTDEHREIMRAVKPVELPKLSKARKGR